ncbi:MAG: hypothetical protein ACRDWD_07000 [Acidimicrobiia bacterium]
MRGMLFSQMEPPPGWEDEFDRWYRDEHVPARVALPGFASASRYRALDGEPWHLAVYHLDDLDALSNERYRLLKTSPTPRTRRMLDNAVGFTRYTCVLSSDTGPPDATPGLLFVVAFEVPEHGRPEFDGWYEEEHVPMLMEAPGWLRVRRFLVQPPSDGPQWTHLALHELRDRRALDAPQRERARTTARRDALATNDWFARNRRWLYEPIPTDA